MRLVWRDEFEALLDAQLSVIRPGWRAPALPERYDGRPDHAAHARCNQKRSALASALAADPELVRGHRAELLHLIVHDNHPSFNEHLITPIVRALGHQAVDEALLWSLENGTYVEQVGALKAWYSGQPVVVYETVDAYHRGEPSAAGAADVANRAALQPRYLEACRRAVESCRDPEEREYLSRWTGSPSIVSIGGGVGGTSPDRDPEPPESEV